MSKIFLSYVRADSEADTGRLADTLSYELPEANLFLDVNNIEFGENWQRVIERAIEDSTILLCVMGPAWKISPAIELELSLAFRSNVPVLPILLRKADLVSLTNDLRPEVTELKYRNAISIEHSSWRRDIAPLMDVLKKIFSDPSRARVIIDPPDPKRLLAITPSWYNVASLLNYAQDLAFCLDDDDVFTKAKEAAPYLETELKRKTEYEEDMRRAGYYYQNIRAGEPRLIQIVQAAKKRLEVEQSIRELITDHRVYSDQSLFVKISQYLDDKELCSTLIELRNEFGNAVREYREGGSAHPAEAKQDFEDALSIAINRLKAEIPGITKRYPDRKWP